MHEFSRKFITQWRKLQLPFKDQTVVAAVSGGADSIALLLALDDLRKRKKLNLRFIIAHFNHNLRGTDSERDAQFVQNLTEARDFELALRIGNISTRGNLEQNARDERYQFLREAAENVHASIILTAHTINDQAESILLNLIRGSGLEGLSGIKQKREISKDSQIILARPLLNWAKRSDTKNFCLENKIQFTRDAMNEDLSFARVRVRKILLPMLKKFNPKIIETLSKTAWLLREDYDALQKTATQYSGNCKNDSVKQKEKYLLIKDLTDLQPSIRRLVLRQWLKNERGDLRQLTTKHFESFENLITSRKSGKIIQLPGGGFVVKEKGKLMFNIKILNAFEN
jgi:tRNA(Ile)-lysidine synthase